MARRLKQAFGLVAIMVGAGMLLATAAQRWPPQSRPIRMGPLVGALVLGAVFISFGRTWLLNLIRLDVLPIEPGNPVIAEASRRAQASLATFSNYLAQNRSQCFVKF